MAHLELLQQVGMWDAKRNQPCKLHQNNQSFIFCNIFFNIIQKGWRKKERHLKKKKSAGVPKVRPGGQMGPSDQLLSALRLLAEFHLLPEMVFYFIISQFHLILTLNTIILD